MTVLTRLIHSVWVYPTALLLGFLQALAFDIPYHSAFTFLSPVLSFVSLLGFLGLLQSLTVKRSLLFGYCYGLGFLGWGLNWIYISMASFGNAPFMFAILANIGVIAYLSLYWLLAAFFITFLTQSTTQRLLIAPAVIVILEWLRSFVLIGFPWLSLGYAWIDSPFAQLARWGGILLVSFMVVTLAVIFLLNIRRIYKVILLTAVTVLSYSATLNSPPSTLTSATTVALVQGNMPVITEYNEERMTENLVQYALLTDDALKSAPKPIDVVVWSESAIPYFYDEVPDFLNELYEQQQQYHFDLISGAPHGSWENNTIYNAVFLQSEADKRPSFYYKQHLLPFGEYLPFRRVFAFFEDFVDIPLSDFSRGDKVQPPFRSGKTTFAPSICFEAVFGDEIRQNAINANVLLNISNDAWFGHSKAQAQHLTIARMRAIENDKPLIRATNNGITAVVSPRGEVEKSLPAFQEGVLIADIDGNRKKQTWYAKFGDLPWVLLFVMLIVFFRSHFLTSKQTL